MREVEIPRTNISGQADSVMLLTGDVPSERMLKGDMVLIRQLHGDEAAIKDCHLYAVIDKEGGKDAGIETKLFRIKRLDGRDVFLYLTGGEGRCGLTKSLDDIYIMGEVLGFQSLVVSPEEVIA